MYLNPTIDTSLGTTPNAIGLLVNPMATSGTANPITNAYGIYAAQPAIGTNRVAIYGGGTIQADSANPAAALIYASSNAPQIGLGNNAVFGSRTQGARFALATAVNNYAAGTQAGDALLFGESNRLILASGSATPILTSFAVQANGSVSIGGVNGFPILQPNHYDMAVYRPDTHSFYYFNGTAWQLLTTEQRAAVGLANTALSTTWGIINGATWNFTVLGSCTLYINVAVTTISLAGANAQANIGVQVDGGTQIAIAYTQAAGAQTIPVIYVTNLTAGAHQVTIVGQLQSAGTTGSVYSGFGYYMVSRL